jgi:hypothetical protein
MWKLTSSRVINIFPVNCNNDDWFFLVPPINTYPRGRFNLEYEIMLIFHEG